MLRSITSEFWMPSGQVAARAPRPGARCPRPRRLAMENLESRKLLTTATLTFNSVSDGNFAAPTLPNATYQLAPPRRATSSGTTYRLPLPVRPGSSRGSPA